MESISSQDQPHHGSKRNIHGIKKKLFEKSIGRPDDVQKRVMIDQRSIRACLIRQADIFVPRKKEIGKKNKF